MIKHFGIVSIVNKFILRGTLPYFDMLYVYKNTNLQDYSNEKVSHHYNSCKLLWFDFANTGYDIVIYV